MKEILQQRNSIYGRGSLIKLNLGCGNNYRDGYVNVDIRNLPRVDIKWRVDDLCRYIKDRTVIEIFAHDVLEHLPIRKVPGALDEWHRMLRPEGILDLNVPDLDILAETMYSYKNDYREMAHMVDRLYGGQDYPGNFHACGFNLTILKKLLEEERGMKITHISRENCNLRVIAQKGR